MKIQRPEMLRQLDSFAQSGHGLVTGEPGVGKTYSVVQLHHAWHARGTPHLIIAVDRLGAVTDLEIRAVLGIDTDLIAHIAQYFTHHGRGVVVFDGFDAARNEAGRERILSLIRRAIESAGGQWTVIVTVRLFDATRSQALRALFRDPAAAPPYKGISLRDTRHFLVPRLKTLEIEAAVAQIEGLSTIPDGKSDELRELLEIPFNLWLVSQVVGGRGGHAALSTVASEAQLLGLYWSRRVLSGEHAQEARHVLTRAVTQMVAAHSLSVRRDQVYDVALAGVWDEVFSAGVIEETGSAQQRIAFSHNILFDYAVSVLLMDDEPEAMTSFIAEDFGRPFFLRPSIAYYYTRLWYDNRQAFWKSVWATLGSDVNHVRLAGRIVASAVIVSEARHVDDLRPAFDRVDRGLVSGADLLLRVFQALSAVAVTHPQPWVDACAELAARPKREYAWNVVTTASRLAEEAGDTLTANLSEPLSVVGRSMLRWALDNRGKNGDRLVDAVGSLWAVSLVAKTFAAAAPESERLLRRVLDLIKEDGFPIEYLYRLCDNVNVLVGVEPSLVGDIYRAVFAHTETSEQETSMGTPILPLRSTRRQDFGMCEYLLLKEFDTFLEESPKHAIQAALDAFSAHAIAEHVNPYLKTGHSVEELTYTLEFRGRSVRVVADQSAIWLAGMQPDDALSLVTKALGRLGKAVDNGERALVDETLDIYSAHARAESAWVLLLRRGAEKASGLGPLLAELALSKNLVRGAYYDVVAFVAATLPGWTDRQRSALEDFVETQVGRAPSSGENELPERIVDLLLMAMPVELTMSALLLNRRRELEASDTVPRNRPPVTFQTTSRALSNEDWLEDRGVDIQSPSNRPLLDAAGLLEELARPWQNKRPEAHAALPIAEAIVASQALLEGGPAGAADVRSMLMTRLASAAVLIAKTSGDVSKEALGIARATLLRAAHSSLTDDPTRGDRVFETPAWSPTPQTEAAQGLPWLIVREADSDVLDAIEHLADCEEPAVRFLVATELFRLRWNAPDRFWRIVESLAERERSNGVLAGLMRSLGSIKREDAAHVAVVLSRLSARGVTPAERSQYAEGYSRLLAWLAFNVEEAWAVSTVDRLASYPIENPALAKQLSFEALSIVTPAFLRDEQVRPMALRGLNWVQRLLTGVASSMPLALAGKADPEGATALYGIVDDVAARVYFGVRRDADDAPTSTEDLRPYFDAVRPLVAAIISFGSQGEMLLIAHTAHHLMQLLHVCLPLDPPGILHLAADVAIASERGGYNLDSMAVSEVVAIADQLLSDHRAILSQSRSLEDFVRLLDTFANAGWPDALRLLWRIDEVFR